MIGLPGTGLGGLFYALLVLWMTAREGWRALRGASSGRNWLKIAPLMAILGGIVAALWLEGWLITAGLEALPVQESEVGDRAAADAGQVAAQALVPAVAIAPLVVLGLLLAALQVLRLAFPRQVLQTVRLAAINRGKTPPLQAVGNDRDFPDNVDEMQLDAAE